jgi:iron complex transport system permease protein
MMRWRLALLVLLLLAAVALFLLWGLRAPYGFILSLRGTKLLSLALVGASVGAATVMFQTVAANRLLTPGIVGFDSLFILLQTALVLTLGGTGYAGLAAVPKFLIEAFCLVAASMALFGWVLRRGADDMMRLILTGVILGVLMRGLAGFMQRILDPSEFAILQQASFATFGAVEPTKLAIAAPLFVGVLALSMRLAPALDVALLGRTGALGLGVDHDRLVLVTLGLISVLVAVATALAGPVTFLGLLAAALAGAVMRRHEHRYLIPASALIGALILVAGQFVYERLLGLQSTLSVAVEFAGGILFLVLVLQRRPT